LPDPDRHLDFAHAQLNHPSVAPWHGGPRTREQVLSWLEAQIAQAAETGFCMWWWRTRDAGELVGYAGLNRDEVEAAPLVEVGWSIAPERWGQGLATEAARAAVEWGFERCGLTEVVSFALLDNVRSRRVMEKLGMTYVRDFERAALPHALYALERPR
jgi:ribosomal-protein-alanine N-acetyltransferase